MQSRRITALLAMFAAGIVGIASGGAHAETGVTNDAIIVGQSVFDNFSSSHSNRAIAASDASSGIHRGQVQVSSRLAGSGKAAS